MEVKKIKVDSILVPEVRASSALTAEQKEMLEASIRQFGFVQPILVRKLDEGKYELVAGNNRLQELKNQGYEEVDAVVTDFDEKSSLVLHLAENMARGITDPVSEAAVLNKFIESGGTIEEASRLTGHTTEWVKMRLAINNLPNEFKKALKEGKIKLGHVELAAQLPSPEETAYCLQLAIMHGWTVSITEAYVKRRLMEWELKQKAGEMKEPPKLPTAQEAAEQVRMFQCSGCERILRNEMQRMPPLCEECYSLLRYITSQLGEPKKAMDKVYQAWLHYERYMEFMKERDMLERMSREQDTSTNPPSSQNINQTSF